MKKTKLKFQDAVPFIAFAVIFLFFMIASYNPKNSSFRLLALGNLSNILSQTMQTILIASGSLFVVAQGHMDMSVGVNLALSGVIGTWVATATGLDFLLIPVSMVIGLAVGLFNGVIVSRFKVPSFMVTLAMLIGVRGLVNYIQVAIQMQKLPESLAFLNGTAVKIPIFIILLLIMAYIFEFTKAGRYSKAIGENEITAKFVGIPIRKMKLLAFALSGLMAGVAAVFSVVTIGATTQQMGQFFEMRVIMAIFLGGVLVSGGSSAKFYKILLGSFSIQIIINGLAIIGRADSYISQSVQGVLLVIILALSMYARMRSERKITIPDSSLADRAAEPAKAPDAKP